jgi:hypothetical protein
MGKVYFCNSEPIDLNAIAIMGVSVKHGENPIGYFGTGLKFSIATLLRTGHDVRLIRNEEVIDFTAEPEMVRGEEFQRVLMGAERLGFTTQLGRNWEPWQAYRELRCNCTDEGGVISDDMPDGEWGTIFEIEGEAICQAHRNRREIFLEYPPISATKDCEIHSGGGRYAFYRGVRAHNHPSHALFTYNVTDAIELTEDRTIKNGWEVGYYAARAIAASSDEDMIEAAVMASDGTFERGLSYDIAGKPSLAFMETMFRLRHNLKCNQSALKLWEQHTDVRLTFTEAVLDAFDEEQIEKAIALIGRLGANIDRRDFIVVESLGPSIFGAVRGSRIMLSKAALDLGQRFIASTLYEEWLHKTQSLRDESRALQNLLFEKLFAMTERVCALEGSRAQKAA